MVDILARVVAQLAEVTAAGDKRAPLIEALAEFNGARDECEWLWVYSADDNRYRVRPESCRL